MGRRPIHPAPRSRARPPSAAALLLLVRHAETEDNVAERLSGWTDGDLSQLGEQQVRLLADHFNRAHGQAAAIYASPLTRARRTAEAIGALTGHLPILLDDLREMHFGELDGRPFRELRQSHGHLLEADDDPAAEDFAWPAGESRRGFVARVRRAIDRIARAHPGEAAAVVTHGGVIAMFLATVHREPVATWRKWIVPNASLTEVEWDPETGTGRLLRHGDAAHLAELTAAETSGRVGAGVVRRLRRSRVMGSPPKDETRQRVERVLEEELAQIDSPEKAREVAERIEQKTAGATEQSKAKEAEQAPPTAAAAVEIAAQKPEPTEQIAEVLVEAAAQAVAKTPEAGAVVEAAREAAGTKRPSPGRPEVQRGHELLQRAVVEQMAPLDSLDARLFVAVNHLPHPRWLDRAADLVTLTTGGGWVWMVSLLLARAYGLPGSGTALRTLVPSLVGTNLIVEGPVKAYFRRRRPFIDIVRAIVVGKKPGNWSFPSGHTAASFATARMLSCVWPRGWPGFYAAAALVGFSRTYTGAHYPSDVLSGAVFGSVLAELIRRGVGPALSRALGGRRWLRSCD